MQCCKYDSSNSTLIFDQGMFLHNGICGRHLVTIDANNLQKMGLYELGTIKVKLHYTKSVLSNHKIKRIKYFVLNEHRKLQKQFEKF